MSNLLKSTGPILDINSFQRRWFYAFYLITGVLTHYSRTYVSNIQPSSNFLNLVMAIGMPLCIFPHIIIQKTSVKEFHKNVSMKTYLLIPLCAILDQFECFALNFTILYISTSIGSIIVVFSTASLRVPYNDNVNITKLTLLELE